jgi:type I restriction enzyme S subunit
VFASRIQKSYLHSASKQTTNLVSINMTQLCNGPCVVPPLAEQRRIIPRVEQLMGLCDELEVRLTCPCTKSERVADAVVHHLTAA